MYVFATCPWCGAVAPALHDGSCLSRVVPLLAAMRLAALEVGAVDVEDLGRSVRGTVRGEVEELAAAVVRVSLGGERG